MPAELGVIGFELNAYFGEDYLIAIFFLIIDVILIIIFGLLMAAFLKLFTSIIKIDFSLLWLLSSLFILIVPMMHERYKVNQWSDFSKKYYDKYYGLTVVKEIPFKTVAMGDSNEDNWGDGASMRIFPYAACLAKYRPIAVYDSPKSSAKFARKPLDGIYGKWKELSLKPIGHADCKPFQELSENKSEYSYQISYFNRFLADEKLSNMCVAIKTLEDKAGVLFLEKDTSTHTLVSNDRYEMHAKTTSLKEKSTNVVYSKFTYLSVKPKQKQFSFRKYLSIGRNIQGLPDIDILHSIFVGKIKKTNKEIAHDKLKITPIKLNLKKLMLSYSSDDINLMLNGKKGLPHRKHNISGHCN